jgi:hypothetical protein
MVIGAYNSETQATFASENEDGVAITAPMVASPLAQAWPHRPERRFPGAPTFCRLQVDERE